MEQIKKNIENSTFISNKKGRLFCRDGNKPYFIYDKDYDTSIVENPLDNSISSIRSNETISELEKTINALSNDNSLDDSNLSLEQVEYIYSRFIKHFKYKEDGLRKLHKLMTHLKANTIPEESDLRQLYNETLILKDGYLGKTIESYPNKLIPCPPQDGRSVLYIVGCSGAGKSYYAASYAREYQRLWPDRRIFMVSRKSYDPAFNDIKMHRILIDDEFIDHMKEDKYNYESMSDSLVIFDDIDTLPKQYKDLVHELCNDLLEVGRANNVSIIRMSHIICKKDETRVILNEAHQFIFFSKGSSKMQLEYCLTNYFSLDKSDINKLINLPSRWVCVSKNYPRYYLCEYAASLF